MVLSKPNHPISTAQGYIGASLDSHPPSGTTGCLSHKSKFGRQGSLVGLGWVGLDWTGLGDFWSSFQPTYTGSHHNVN